MWSLFKKVEDEKKDSGIFEFSSEKLVPLKFSNGKTQEDIVNEVLDLIKNGEKIIFVKGVCGSGKSAIALNLAKHFKKASIVVPIKSLQDQYEKDYMDKKFILKEDGKKLKISVIKGRANFSCKYLSGKNADYELLPCTIELREKNMPKILEFIEENKEVRKEDFSRLADVRRISVAGACDYWSPLMPSDSGGKILGKAKKKKYNAINEKEYALFQRASGCGYCEQYHSYIDSDVLIFNAQKYLLEVAMGRKPKTEIDIIDECDDFLDSFADEKKINLNRLVGALSSLQPENRADKDAIKQIINLANRMSAFYSEEIVKLEKSEFYDLFEKILDNPYLAEDEDKNYYNSVFEAVKSFEELKDETYVALEKDTREQTTLFGKENNIFVSMVSINLAKRFKELSEKSNALVLMSGTIHSENVLKDIFGLTNFKIVEAETRAPGVITKYRTGLEKNCKYSNLHAGENSRENYLRALNSCLEKAKLPVLVHISSFGDLPSNTEKEKFGLKNLMSREELTEMQKKSGNVRMFKEGKIKSLFTTKCSRGVDFPGEECNSIVLTKYPYPNLQGIFWKILKKEQPEKFVELYLDKAKRDLVQKIARGIRFIGDHIFLLSPDSRVLDAKLD